MSKLKELRELAEAMADGALAYYEHDAALFYAETAQLAPGKDDCLPPTISDQERRDLWIAFLDRKKKERGEEIRALLDLIEAQHEAHLGRVECRHRGECPGCDERTDAALALYDKLDGGEA